MLSAKTPTMASGDNHWTCHGHLGRRDTDRIVSIYVATPKVVKASKEGDIAGVFAYKFRQCKSSIRFSPKEFYNSVSRSSLFLFSESECGFIGSSDIRRRKPDRRKKNRSRNFFGRKPDPSVFGQHLNNQQQTSKLKYFHKTWTS